MFCGRGFGVRPEERGGISKAFNRLQNLAYSGCFFQIAYLSFKNSDTLLLIVASVMWVSEKIVILGLIDRLF